MTWLINNLGYIGVGVLLSVWKNSLVLRVKQATFGEITVATLISVVQYLDPH